MCDCAEELERKQRAEAENIERALAALRAQSAQPSFFQRLFGFLGVSQSTCPRDGAGGGGSKWTVVGGAALLLGLLGVLYKYFGDQLNLNNLKMMKQKGKDPCENEPKPVKPPPPKPITPCTCD